MKYLVARAVVRKSRSSSQSVRNMRAELLSDTPVDGQTMLLSLGQLPVWVPSNLQQCHYCPRLRCTMQLSVAIETPIGLTSSLRCNSINNSNNNTNL